MSGPDPETRFDAFKLAARASSVSGSLDAETDGEVILADRPLDAATLVEDELVLTLPFAPRHEGECPGRR